LIWDDSTNWVDIHPKDEGEFCHVAFTDNNFRDEIAAMIASEQAETDPNVSAQNGLVIGTYRIKITVTGEPRVATSRLFSLVVGQNTLQIIPIDSD
jgi:hypothetical protein